MFKTNTAAPLRHAERRIIKAADRRAPTFAQALLSQRWTAYLLYRLRLPVLSTVLFSVIQMIEYVYFYQIFAPKFSVIVLVAMNLGGILRAGHWGLLEDLRRYARSQTHWQHLSPLVKVWLFVSGVLASSFVISLLAIGIFYRVDQEEFFLISLTITAASVTAIFAEMILQVWISALAAKRFPRRFVYLWATEILTPVVVIAGASFIGSSAVGLGIILAVSVRFLIMRRTIAAELQARKLDIGMMRLAVSPLAVFKSWREVRALVSGRRAVGGFAVSCLERVGHIVTLWFLLAEPFSIVAITFHLMTPAVNAAAGWCRCFYFDLVSPKNAAWQPMMLSLERRLHVFSIFIGSLFLGLAAVAVLWSFPQTVWYTVLVVAPFVLVSAILSPRLLLSFIDERYGRLAGFWLFAFAAAAAANLALRFEDDWARVLTISLVLLLATLFLPRRRAGLTRADLIGKLLPFWQLIGMFNSGRPGYALVRVKLLREISSPAIEASGLFELNNGFIVAAALHHHDLVLLMKTESVIASSDMARQLFKASIFPLSNIAVCTSAIDMEFLEILTMTMSAKLATAPITSCEAIIAQIKQWIEGGCEQRALVIDRSGLVTRGFAELTSDTASAIKGEVKVYLQNNLRPRHQSIVRQSHSAFPVLGEAGVIGIIACERPVAAAFYEALWNYITKRNVEILNIP